MKSFNYIIIAALLIVIVTILAFGLRGTTFRTFTSPPVEIFPDMDRQAKKKSQAQSPMFKDGRADRLPIAGTIPFKVPNPKSYFASGIINGNWGTGFPEEVKVTKKFIERGRERYNINCAICHGASGSGQGVTSKYGLNGIADLHQKTFIDMPDGQIFYTIGHGKGNMGAYPHLKYDDRWAIVAYVRALQRSQNAKLTDLPEDKRNF